MAQARSTGSEFRPLEIVPMARADLDEVMAIESRAFEDPWPRQAFETDLADAALAYMRVAKVAGRIVGYIVAWRVAGEMHLTNLAVSPEFRRSRVAHGLVAALFGEAHAVGAETITLEVRRSNQAAIKLYLGCGFESVGIRRNYYRVGGEDAVIMRAIPGKGENP